jgi:hypothetical protein
MRLISPAIILAFSRPQGLLAIAFGAPVGGTMVFGYATDAIVFEVRMQPWGQWELFLSFGEAGVRCGWRCTLIPGVEVMVLA